MNKLMVLKANSPAFHVLGDIGGSEYDEFIHIFDENKKYFIGNFEEGFGFVDVKFLKSDCRDLNEDEVEFLNKQHYAIGNQVMYKMEVNKDGTFPEEIG
jgi:hypothetical protein